VHEQDPCEAERGGARRISGGDTPRRLDLIVGEPGLAAVQPLDTGRPSYHPSTMLKLYVYGYLNGFRRAGAWSGNASAISRWSG
jgi:hypothetical protein